MAGRRDARSAGRSCLAAVGLAAVLGGCSAHHADDASKDAGRPAAASPPARTAHAPGSRAVRALRQWDRQRSAAYAAGSTARLRRLYVPGSRAGEADVDLLQHYLRRGFRVRGMRTQLLAATVLDHREDRWRVRVTDRLVGAVATGAGQRMRLPQGRAGGYVLTLERHEGRWLMAATRRTPNLLS